jgi:hypothetical protein
MKQTKMIQMRQKAMEIQDRLMSSDIEVARAAEKDLERLLEAYCNENKDMLAPQQHETAKRDFGYFLSLIEMAIGYYAAEAQDVANPTLH